MKKVMTTMVFVLGMSFLALPSFGMTISSLVGDKDAFGIPGAPNGNIDGMDYIVDLGGAFFRDYRTAEDRSRAPHTDLWYSTVQSGPPTWTHVYDLNGQTPISANLELTVAGIADLHPVSLLADGIPIHTLDFHGQGTTTHVLAIPVPLSFLDGATEFSFLSTHSQTPFQDNFIIDFTQLTITTRPNTAVPEPSTLLLLGSGLLGLGIWCTKHRRPAPHPSNTTNFHEDR